MTRLPDPKSDKRKTADLGPCGLGTCLLFVQFPADANTTRAALARMQSLFLAIGLAQDAQCDVVIALSEAINNIVEHALGDHPAGCIGLSCYQRDDTLLVRLRDNGVSMPGLQAPMGANIDLSVSTADLPEGGFGWFLIRQLTSDVRYHRECGRNRLDLWFRLPQPT